MRRGEEKKRELVHLKPHCTLKSPFSEAHTHTHTHKWCKDQNGLGREMLGGGDVCMMTERILEIYYFTYTHSFLSVRDKVLYRKRRRGEKKHYCRWGSRGGNISTPTLGKKKRSPKNSSRTHSCAFASAGVMVRLSSVVCRLSSSSPSSSV